MPGSLATMLARKSSYLYVDPTTRARMQAVRRCDTGPELRVRRLLHSLGYRYRLHRRTLPGSPDIVFPGRRKVIFVHGCFWHGHPECKRATLPKKNGRIWAEKIRTNQVRDAQCVLSLERLGWGVLVIWECETNHLEKSAPKLRAFLQSR
jgi:DNA mismatch endonuclease, patch repair protein